MTSFLHKQIMSRSHVTNMSRVGESPVQPSEVSVCELSQLLKVCQLGPLTSFPTFLRLLWHRPIRSPSSFSHPSLSLPINLFKTLRILQIPITFYMLGPIHHTFAVRKPYPKLITSIQYISSIIIILFIISTMNNNREVHFQGKVPFSWENKPGIRKSKIQGGPPVDEGQINLKVPPPPCRVEIAGAPVHDIPIPLPPCAFQPPQRSSSKRGLKKTEDPFLAAYKECTKSSRKGTLTSGDHRKSRFSFSCKHSCSVRDDNFVKISEIPHSVFSETDSQRERRERELDELVKSDWVMTVAKGIEKSWLCQIYH